MPRSPQDLYARLLSSTHGYPLWTPDPSNEFLRTRPEGLRIGDVGVVNPDYGGFDALFNLCLPREHHFHRYGVPDSFTCFRPEELETSTSSAEPQGRVISTPSVTRLGTVSSTEAPQRDESGISAYRFNLSSDEGALLILPEGAERYELLNDGLFIEQASQHGAEWHSYAVNRRHRRISQDALYVITGLHKTRSWSIAAFENVAGNESYAAQYKHIPDRSSTAPMYGWETTRASLHWRAGTSIDYGEPSQTVFIRGLKITLRNGFLGSRRISVEADTPSKARSNPVKSLSVVPSGSRMGWERARTSRTIMHAGRSTDAAEEQTQSDMSDHGGYEDMHVEIQRVPNVPPAFHPSNAINQYLLRKDPSANIAITCDSIWMSILAEKLLTTEEFDEDFRLEKVLFQNYDIVSHEGVVRLERKSGTLVDRQTRSRSSTPPISDPNSASVQSDHVSQVSTSRNPKDADKKDLKEDLLVNESEVDAQSHLNVEVQSITSGIGSEKREGHMVLPFRKLVFPRLILGSGAPSSGSTPMSTEYFQHSDPPHEDLSPSTHATHSKALKRLSQAKHAKGGWTHSITGKATVSVDQILLRADSAFAKFQEGEGTDHISEAVVLDRQALDLCSPGHHMRWESLNQLATHLQRRYNHLGEIADIEEARIWLREALELCPSQHPGHSRSLNNLVLCLFDHYRRLGDMTDLNEAIILGRQALDLCPPGHPDRSTSLNNVALGLSDRYRRLGDMVDLNEAIILCREALDLCPPGHPARSTSLNNVSLGLSDRYRRLGDMEDLNKAIILCREALDLCPSGHPDRSRSLDNLVGCLSDRYKQLGDMTDLNEAIILGKQALDLCPPGHPARSTSLNNVALGLSDRYKQLGDIMDLNEATILGTQALDLCPPGHPERSTSLNNVALGLYNRYRWLGDITDLNDAIAFWSQALDLCQGEHPGRSMLLNNVALGLSDRYKHFEVMTDLNEAIIFGRQALYLCPPGHPNRSCSLHQLAGFLRVRFTQSRKLRDRDELFSLYTELANITQMVSSFDLSAAKEWTSVAEDYSHPTMLLAYETSLRLLIQHLATLPSLPNHLQIFVDLASSLAVDAFSACLRNQRAKKAVELLEQGRGVFWNQIARLRSPLEDVIAFGQEGKALADDFTRLSSEICNTIHSQAPDQHNRLCSLNVDLQSAITKIRKLPGLARFHLPSSFSELQHAASGGPVVIVNASRYTCDALIIFFDRDPVHIPLQITESHVQDLSLDLQSLTSDANNDLVPLLRILWDEIVSPIADFLQTTVPHHSRIWWCPTAEFCLLPLHAAGPYRKGQKNFSHLYISSYTLTLNALIRARRNDPLATTSTHEKQFLAVGEASPKGQSKLLSVGSELTIVAERVQDLATFVRLEGPEARISQVEKELRRSDWVHFACHGIPNKKQPFDSAFGLYDGHFTIEHIMGCELENPEFAYLSADHTTVGGEGSTDEMIHLASAMQFAGFRSVIGTMWAVDDAEANKIVSKFYENLVNGSGQLDYTRAALALQKTMNSLGSSVPLDQRILYVHIGA